MTKTNTPKPKATLLRRPGRLKGRIKMAATFDAPLPAALLKAFSGTGP